METTNWETTTCSRCGGTGNYSYTQTWGYTCFKCGIRPHQPGTGRMLTKAGAAARDAYYAANTVTIPVNEVVAGDIVIRSGRRWQVVEVRVGEFGRGSWSVGTPGTPSYRSGTTHNTHALVDKRGTSNMYDENAMVDVWRPIIDPAPAMEANINRRVEMRAYVKAANAAAAAAGRLPVAA